LPSVGTLTIVPAHIEPLIPVARLTVPPLHVIPEGVQVQVEHPRVSVTEA